MKDTIQEPHDDLVKDSEDRREGHLMPVTARGEATRRKILDAAEEVFGEMGYYEGSVSEITRRAGVAQGTFYLYFHTKREIFVELVMDIGVRLRAATSAAIAGIANRLEAEQRGFEAFFQFVQQHRAVYNIVQEAERVAPEAAREYYMHISAGYQHGLQAAIDAGELRDLNPEAMGYALMGIAHFVALRWILWPWIDDNNGNPPQVPAHVKAALFSFIANGLQK